MVAHNSQDGQRSNSEPPQKPSRFDRRRIIELIALAILAATVLALVIVGKAPAAVLGASAAFIVAGLAAFRGTSPRAEPPASRPRNRQE
ncbi:hypothetical protein [Nocardia asiatica]|uniref:hypothetical protein n=1 Tax=Nocardia asiatica TaxID=209252 RepID=UPI003EE3F7D3